MARWYGSGRSRGGDALSERQLGEIERDLGTFLEHSGTSLGLPPGPYDLAYISNPGGFVNANFVVRCDSRRWHCKLAPSDWTEGMERWWRLREHLGGRYRAPELLAWFELETVDRTGFISEYAPGTRADYSQHAHLWPHVAALASRLHGDEELAKQLAESTQSGSHTTAPHPEASASCFDYLCGTELAMLEADIAETRVHPACPDFVDESFWEWASGEVEHVRELARGSRAFAAPADSVVHGDLWEANVLVGERAWWIIDWDELALGDPAKDVTDWWWTADRPPVEISSETEARLPIWWRTRQLVYAVDPVADWAEAHVAPEPVRKQMRDFSRWVHETGYARYLADYRRRTT